MKTLFENDLIWGAWRARHSDMTREPDGFARLLALCLELEINWIDHADIYDDGAVEDLHGRAIQHLSAAQRQGLRVMTKCGVRFPSPGQPGVRTVHYRSDAAYLHQQADASLQRLGVDQIDLYLLHRPDYLMQAEETARALEDLHTTGKIAAYGVSNFSIHQLERLRASTDLPMAAHQIEISVGETSALDDGRLDQAARLDMPLLAWSPLAGGRLFHDGGCFQPLRERLEQVAQEMDAGGIDEIALAWLKSLPARIQPILGTMQPDRLRRQVMAYRALILDRQDWYAILEAERGTPVP